MSKEKPSLKPSPSADKGKQEKEGGKTAWRVLTPLFIVAGIGGLTGLGLLAWKHFAPKAEADPYIPDVLPGGADLPALPAPSSTATTPAKGSGKRDDSFPLSLGSYGQRVKVIQKALNIRHKTGLTVDGEWGVKTQDAMVKHRYPTTVTEQQYALFLSWIAAGGLSGLPAQVATARPAMVWSVRLQQAVPLRAGTLLGTFAGDEGGGFLRVLTPAGDILLVRSNDTLSA